MAAGGRIEEAGIAANADFDQFWQTTVAADCRTIPWLAQESL